MEFREEIRFDYPVTVLSPDAVVLDCGGYKGDFAHQIHSKYGCVVHVLEPVQQFFEQIARRFDGSARVHVYNWGIGAESGPAEFSIKGDMTGKYADNPETETVHIKGVQEVFDRLKLGEVGLMKLNVEGGEWEVIPALISSGLIKRIQNLQVQWHQVGGGSQERFDALQHALSETHSLSFDHGWVWQNWVNK
jgi:FkbM family methyltransferase